MESELALLREENARLTAKITGLEFEKAELIERVAKLEEKQLENVVIKNLLHASQVGLRSVRFGSVFAKTETEPKLSVSVIAITETEPKLSVLVR